MNNNIISTYLYQLDPYYAQMNSPENHWDGVMLLLFTYKYLYTLKHWISRSLKGLTETIKLLDSVVFHTICNTHYVYFSIKIKFFTYSKYLYIIFLYLESLLFSFPFCLLLQFLFLVFNLLPISEHLKDRIFTIVKIIKLNSCSINLINITLSPYTTRYDETLYMPNVIYHTFELTNHNK